MKRFYLLFAAFLFALGLNAQSQVQIIHAAPAAEAADVDIYLFGTTDSVGPINLAFTEATAFTAVPGDTYTISFYAAGADTSSASPAKEFPGVAIPADDTLVVAAFGGTLEELDLAIAQGINDAVEANSTSALVFHGSPDAPAVDVDARDGSATAALVTNLAPGAFTADYASVPAVDYNLDVRGAGSPDVVTTFFAPLNLFEGEPAVVVATGFLAPAEGQPAFGLYAIDRTGLVIPLSQSPSGLIINEVAYSTGNDEFVELYNAGATDIILDAPLTLLGINGGTGDDYFDTDLVTGDTIAPGEYYVVCYGGNSEAYCDFSGGGTAIQNGPDAVAITFGLDTLDVVGYGGDVGEVPAFEGEPFGDVANELSLSRRPDGVDTDDNSVDFSAFTPTPGAANEGAFVLQLLHASDLEGGVDAIGNAPAFAAIIDTLEDLYENTLRISGGDNYIPGPFFDAAADGSLRAVYQDVYQTLLNEPGLTNLREAPGRADITIMNIIGFDASAIGNHEFDAGTNPFGDIIGTDIRGTTLGDTRWLGARFPYLSANLDFSGDGTLNGLFTDEILPNTDFISDPSDLAAAGDAPKIAPATLIMRGGEMIGVVGATTQIVEDITSNGGVTEISSPGVDDMPALAAVLQPVIDDLIAAGANKIIVTTHLQQISLEKELATLLSGVDIVVAGGSDVLQARPNNPLRPGDAAEEPYPFVDQNADGDPVLVVGTDGEYTYVGRLIVDFDEQGVLIENSWDRNDNGAVATTAEVVDSLWGANDEYAEGTKGELVQRITGAVEDFVASLDVITIGQTDVFIEGRRAFVRTQETSLGSLTADANLAAAREFDNTVAISLKNGGGIRSAIGTVDMDGTLLPPQANPNTGRPANVVTALDVVNSLRFNNELSLLSLSSEQLQEVLEHGFAASDFDPENQQGRFPQVGGIRVEVDFNQPAGSRVRRASLTDDEGAVTEDIIVGGEVVDAEATYRVVTLNFLADGGDGYPYDEFENTDRVDLVEVLADTMDFNFADPGTEQDALAEFFNANFGETPFDGERLPAERIVLATPVSNVQVIHNSPNAGAADGPAVDIYVNDALLPALDSVPFQAATPFLEVPGDTTLKVDVYAAGTDTTGTAPLFTQNFPELGDGNYVLMASGIVGETDVDSFRIAVLGMAQTMGSDMENVDLAVYHGATDAPAVDVDARFATGVVDSLVDSLAFGDFTMDYLSVPANDYRLDVRANGSPDVVASFVADLRELGGGAGVVFASGFLAPAGDAEPFGLFAALPDGTVIELPADTIEEALVQIIHNSPDPAADTVTVILGANTVAVPALAYREATPFVFVPVDSAVTVATKGATDTTGTTLLQIPGGTLSDGDTVVVIAAGTTDSMDLGVFPNAAQIVAADEANVDLLAFHGSNDAPTVTVAAKGVGALFPDLAYQTFSADYVSVPAADGYLLDVIPQGTTIPVATFGADVAALAGGAGVAFASGFVDPGDTPLPAFGLFVALPDGQVIELPAVETVAEVQLIHNSPDAGDVSIILGADSVLVDSFPFRGATPFVEVPIDSSISIVPFGDTDTANAVLTVAPLSFNAQETYVAIATGEALDMDLSVEVFEGALQMTAEDSVSLLAFHGVSDAPTVLINERIFVGGPIFEPLSFKQFSSAYTTIVPLGGYILDVTTLTGDPVASFLADVQPLAGQAATVFASGFAAPVDDEPAFGLWVALADGTTFPLPSAGDSALVQIIHNSPAPVVNIDVIAVGADTVVAELDSVAYRTATPFLGLPAGGYAVRVESLAGDSVLQDTLMIMPGGTYAVIANGELGNAERPFELAVTEQASTGNTVGGFDMVLFHGSQDAPSVDLDFNAVNVPGVPPLFTIAGLDYGAFEFVPIPPSGLALPEVFVGIRAAGSPDVVKLYRVALPEIVATGETAAIAIASGFLGEAEDSETAFALLAVLPDGTVIPLQEVATSSVEAEDLFEGFVLFPNPVNTRAQVRFNLIEASQVRYEIFDINGRRVEADLLGNLPSGMFTQDLNTSNLPNGTYIYRLSTNNGTLSTRFTVVK